MWCCQLELATGTLGLKLFDARPRKSEFLLVSLALLQVIAGANLILVDFHPHPEQALCDGPQALLLEELPSFLEDVSIVREAYEKRLRRVAKPPAAS